MPTSNQSRAQHGMTNKPSTNEQRINVLRGLVIDELVMGLPDPGFAPMPGDDERIPFVLGTKLMSGGKAVEANVPQIIYATI